MIGKLDQKITLRRFVSQSDGAGGQAREWQDFDCTPCVWARVTPRVFRETKDEGRQNASYVVQFTIRNRSDIDETCAIRWDGVDWNIRGILREGSRAMYLTIEAERGTAS